MRQPAVVPPARASRPPARRDRWPGGRTLLLLVATLTLGAAGCARNSRPEAPQEPTTLEVQNQAFLDMTIYVLRGTERVRLGQATGNSTTKLRIPNYLIVGPTQLHFLADPIGSNRTTLASDITVSPGEEVVLMIPPT